MKTIRNRKLIRELEQYSPTLRVFIRVGNVLYPIDDVFRSMNATMTEDRIVIESWAADAKGSDER